VHHHAWVAECGTLDGVFTRKGGTKEEPAGWRQLALRVEPIRELVGMLKKDFGQAMMSSIEPSQYIFKTVLYFFVRQVQDSLQDRIRPRLLLIKALVAWDKEPSYYPRCISRDMDWRTSNERRSEH
jgi:hypothetical protein